MTSSRLFFARRPALLGSLCLLAVLAAVNPAAAARYAQGERVQITGAVADAQGQPLPNVRVTFEASRTYFSMRQLRRTEAEEVHRVSAITDASGQYTLEWPWDSYFNHFELAVGMPVKKAREERLEELERVDVTQRAFGGSPVVNTIVVRNAAFITHLRDFIATVRTDDQHRVYDEMGRPDKVEVVQYPGWAEVSWWYFDSGRVYRFRDGRLEQVVPFDPVKGS
jgi:hypothetical protein